MNRVKKLLILIVVSFAVPGLQAQGVLWLATRGVAHVAARQASVWRMAVAARMVHRGCKERCPYVELGIQPGDETSAKVKKEYHRRAGIVHPDVRPESDRALATAEFRYLNLAYEVLSGGASDHSCPYREQRSRRTEEDGQEDGFTGAKYDPRTMREKKQAELDKLREQQKEARSMRRFLVRGALSTGVITNPLMALSDAAGDYGFLADVTVGLPLGMLAVVSGLACVGTGVGTVGTTIDMIKRRKKIKWLGKEIEFHEQQQERKAEAQQDEDS